MQNTLVAPYTTVPEIGGDVACVIVEPVAANMGLVAPSTGFLEGCARACDAVGALLIFDEVITGFRLGRGGAAGAFGVRADLYCFGKVIGGGLPLACLGGGAIHMEQLAPTGPVYQAGTLSGNPLATAAGLAVLEHLLDELVATAPRWRRSAGRRDSSEAFARPASRRRSRSSGRCSASSSATKPSSTTTARSAAANGIYATFFHAMLERGVALAPSAYEVAFCSLAHGDGEIDRDDRGRLTSGKAGRLADLAQLRSCSVGSARDRAQPPDRRPRQGLARPRAAGST